MLQRGGDGDPGDEHGAIGRGTLHLHQPYPTCIFTILMIAMAVVVVSPPMMMIAMAEPPPQVHIYFVYDALRVGASLWEVGGHLQSKKLSPGARG